MRHCREQLIGKFMSISKSESINKSGIPYLCENQLVQKNMPLHVCHGYCRHDQ